MKFANNKRRKGKVVGKFAVKTTSSDYSVETRFDIESKMFVAYFPGVGGGLDSARGMDFEALKREVQRVLDERDTTTYHDVLECSYGVRLFREGDGLTFSFEVRRVSDAVGANGYPRQEIDVEVSEEGEVSAATCGGEPTRPRSYRGGGVNVVVPFTVSRWRLCHQIRETLSRTGKAIEGLLGGGSREEVAARMDAMVGRGRGFEVKFSELDDASLRPPALRADEESS